MPAVQLSFSCETAVTYAADVYAYDTLVYLYFRNRARSMRMRAMMRPNCRIVQSFSRMCNFPKDGTGVTKFSTIFKFTLPILQSIRGSSDRTPSRVGTPFV